MYYYSKTVCFLFDININKFLLEYNINDKIHDYCYSIKMENYNQNKELNLICYTNRFFYEDSKENEIKIIKFKNNFESLENSERKNPNF